MRVGEIWKKSVVKKKRVKSRMELKHNFAKTSKCMIELVVFEEER
jgi:hypothetical protein